MKRRIAMAVLSASLISASGLSPLGAQTLPANKVFRFVPVSYTHLRAHET